MHNIFYFHGLDSFLTDDKRKILEKFGKVTAPTFNYRDPQTLNNILESFDDLDMKSTIFIGSSFGGYVANLLSVGYDKPCLLFNPALAYRNVDLTLEEPFDPAIKSVSWFVLGEKDDVVNCNDNLEFISKHIKGPKKVIIEKELGHRIPLDIFEKYVSRFFKSIDKKEKDIESLVGW